MSQPTVSFRACCEDTLIAAPNRHEPGFETTCACGNIIRATVWQNGWEVYETHAGALGAKLYTRGEGVAIELTAQLNALGVRSREALLKDLEHAASQEQSPHKEQ